MINTCYPSRVEFCKLFTQENWSGIISLYENPKIIKKLWITTIGSNIRKEVNSIYLTAKIIVEKRLDCKVLKQCRIDEILDDNFICNYLRLNQYIVKNKILSSTDDMRFAAEIGDYIEKNYKNKEFNFNDLGGQSICVVGNAPVQEEVGKDIDEADIVLRFNNYQIVGFERYIGTKTNYWCRISNLQKICNKSQSYIYTDNPLDVKLGISFFKDFVNDNKKYFLNNETVISLSKQIDAIPSSGLRILWLIAHSNVKNIKIHGFSFLRNSVDDRFSHYFGIKKSKGKFYKSKTIMGSMV